MQVVNSVYFSVFLSSSTPFILPLFLPSSHPSYEKLYKLIIFLVDGKLTPWSDWTECNVRCGLGEQFRVRSCEKPENGGKTCNGKLKEFQTCQGRRECPGSKRLHYNIFNSIRPIQLDWVGQVSSLKIKVLNLLLK
jgi:hypothetical protein